MILLLLQILHPECSLFGYLTPKYLEVERVQREAVAEGLTLLTI
jgi:hypothetical protein